MKGEKSLLDSALPSTEAVAKRRAASKQDATAMFVA